MAFDSNAVHTDIRETRPVQDSHVENETGIVLDEQIDGRYGRNHGVAYPLAIASPDIFSTSSVATTTPSTPLTSSRTSVSNDEDEHTPFEL